MFGKQVRIAAVAIVVALALSCGGGASNAFREGRKAELHKDWDTALVDYQKALQTDPANTSYMIHERQARSQASLFHLKNGRQLLKDNRQDQAAGEFQKAAAIDPSNEAAGQELARLLAKQAEAKKAREVAIQKALQTPEVGPPGAVQLKPLSQEPIPHIRMPSLDARKVFETLGQLAGINVAFTSDFRPGQNISLDLVNVKIEDALKIAALQTKSFWKPITTNTILIVPDNLNNRREYEDQVVKTVYLSNPLAAADRTAISTALKQVLGLQHIMDNPDSNAIVLQGSAAQIAAAEQLIHELDRAKAEILVDVDVVEADRDRIRNLGLSFATISGTTVTPGVQGAAIFAPGTSTSSSSTSTSTSGSTIPVGNISWRDYAAVLPSAAAQAVMSDNKTHILQSPEVRVTDGQTAKLKIGTRVPIATGSFLPSLGGTAGTSGGGIGLLASTQFQYQDVGVNLEITPRVLATGEVALHAHIEISSLGAPLTVGGISEPTFSQRVIEHDIRLREGEVNLLGGLIQRTQTNTVNGLPFLSDIPVLGALFSQTTKEINEQEVMVMLTPRVIRLPEPATTAASRQVPAGSSPVGGGIGRMPTEMPQVPEGPPEPGGPPQ